MSPKNANIDIESVPRVPKDEERAGKIAKGA